MIVEKFKEILKNNPKLISNSFVIENYYPKHFVFGEGTNSTIKVHFHKNNFKKLLKKLDLEYLPVIFKITYIGYGLIGRVVEITDKNNIKVKYSFFSGRRVTFFPRDYDDYKPGDSVEINYIAIPYLILPSITFSIRKKKELKVGDIVDVFVIHEYHLEALTEIGGREIPLFKHSWYPNVAFPPFDERANNYYDDLIDYLKRYYAYESENYYHEIRKDVSIVEATIKKKPIKIVIISPYTYTETIEEKADVEKTIKEYGYGNLRKLVKLGKTQRVLEVLENTRLNLSLNEMFSSAIKIVVGSYGELDKKEKINVRIVSGRAIIAGSELKTMTEEWEKTIKFKAKDLKKRKEEKIAVKIPKVGTSISYKPDREDIRSIKEILLDQEIEILRSSEFDEILKEFEETGIAIKNFDSGIKVFPYVKVEVYSEDELLFEQIIPYIYSIKIAKDTKK